MSAKVVFDSPIEDVIETLPVDQNPPSHNEMQILDTLFRKSNGTMQKLFDGTKDVMLVGLLFILLSIPQIDDVIRQFVPSTANSPYILILVKAICFMLLYFVIRNMYLVRKA